MATACLFAKPIHLRDSVYGWRDSGDAEEVVFSLLTSFSVGLNAFVMIISAYSLIFASDLAYRGGAGSMARAIDGMKRERKIALRLYWSGVCACLLTAASFMWLRLREEAQVTVVCVIAVFGVLTVGIVRMRVRPRFLLDTAAKASAKQKFVLHGGYDPEIEMSSSLKSNSAPSSR